MSLISRFAGGCGRGDSGIAGRQVCRPVGIGLRRSGLPSADCVARIIGSLALVGLTGLHHWGGVAATRHQGRVGVVGSGIRVTIRWISVHASWSCFSSMFTRSWWALAQSSTFPWKLARCWVRATIVSTRKDNKSFTGTSWVTRQICRWLVSLVRSIMACQTSVAKTCKALAAAANSLHIHSSVIFSLVFTRSYVYLVPSARAW